MDNNIKISTTLANGTKVEYNVILTFKSLITGKNYCVYTDNTIDKNQKLRFYTAVYNPAQSQPYLGEPTTKDEWNEITKVIDSVIPA